MTKEELARAMWDAIGNTDPESWEGGYGDGTKVGMDGRFNFIAAAEIILKLLERPPA